MGTARRFALALGRHPVRGALGVALILGGIAVIAAAVLTPTYLPALLHR